MKFLNKKEQVMDFKLTSYGHYLLSIGKFKPQFYAFYDDNVLYDGAYAQISESSNSIHDRIKNKTQYLESQVLFEEIEQESNIIDEGSMSYYELDVTPIMEQPRQDVFKFEHMIGDAYLDGDKNVAPAWKIVVLNGDIKSSTLKDSVNEFEIPQINIQLNYRKKIITPRPKSINTTTEEIGKIRRVAAETNNFADNKIIQLETDDLILYAEEQNTQLLVENFDIEVYEILTGALPPRCPDCAKQDKFKRKYFENDFEHINGGFMNENSADSLFLETTSLSTDLSSSVSYYFDINTDESVEQLMACKASEIFNKQSLYIDLDFDCEGTETEFNTFDIYGVVTEPEICQ
jgi:hypothetical protein